MSGIVGIVQGDGAPVDRALLEELTAFQAFRGPDGQASWVGESIGLGHTHLRATSRSEREHQPCSLEGRVWITADVRLDGREELIGKLRGRGRVGLPDASDAELILHAYLAWGDDCLRHLLGDFAFALWDRPRRRLLCAVDPFRVKLFYYAQVGDSFVFSNTLDCLRLHPDVSDRLNETAVGDFLLFQYYQDPGITIYADVQRLPPAHCLTWEEGRLRVVRYWSVPSPEAGFAGSPRDCLEQFDHLLTQAVGDRLNGPRIGIYLSGGLDSPVLAAKAQGLLARPGAAGSLRAFTVVFDHLIPDQERYYSGLVAQALGIPHQIETGDQFEFYGGTDGPIWPPPEPVNEPRWDWGLRFVHRVAAECPLVLTGDDGDTLLKASMKLHLRGLLRGGHLGRLVRDLAWYVATQRHLPYVGFRTSLKRRLGIGQPSQLRTAMPTWLNPEFSRRVHLADRWHTYTRPRVPTSPRGQARDNLALPIWASVFDSYDAGWTGCSLEFRHPFMDVRLVTFLLGLPAIPWCVQKELFRRWLRPVVPSEVHRRPKTCLAEDPVQVKLHQGDEPWEGLAWEPELTDYVELGSMPRRCSSSNIDDVNVWLRPFSLNSWLGSRKERKGDHGYAGSKRG